MRAVILLLALLCMTGCIRSPGTSEAVYVETKANGQTDAQPTVVKTRNVELEIPPGYDVKVSSADAKQPSPPDTPAIAEADEKGARSDSGDAGKSASDIGLGGTMWIGICLVIAGLLIFLAKRAGWASVIAPGPTGRLMKIAASLPKGSGVGIMLLGGSIIILPWFLDTIEPIVIPAVCVVGVGFFGWWMYNMIEDKKKENAEEAKPPNRDAEELAELGRHDE